MLVFMAPMIVLYFVGVMVSYVVVRRKRARALAERRGNVRHASAWQQSGADRLRRRPRLFLRLLAGIVLRRRVPRASASAAGCR